MSAATVASPTAFVATPKQRTFIEAVMSGRYRFLCYGGAIRGGKSYCVVALLFLLCRIFPGSRWAIVRKDLPTLRRNTVPVLEKLRPHRFCGPLNQSTWSYTCTNGSEILLVAESLKDDPDLNRFKGLEVNGFVGEEVNELAEKTHHKFIERAGSWIIPGAAIQPPPLCFYTCNPASNWVKRVFYDPWAAGSLAAPFFYLPATIDDNPHVTPEYRASLESLPPAEYRRFVKGDWGVQNDPDQLIQFEWVTGAKDVEHVPGIRRLGVDVARFGDDDSVFAELDGNALVALEGFHGLSTTRTAVVVQERMVSRRIGADETRIDGTGLGAGVVDNCRAAGFEVVDIVSGGAQIERADSVFKFLNRRSQMWWELREKLRLGQNRINADTIGDVAMGKLVSDLIAPRYEIRADKTIAVERKEQIKKRLGRSTDYGDAYVYGDAELEATPFFGFA